MKSVLEELQARNCLEQISDENLWKNLAETKHTMYIGFDPTADSLHLGNLIPIMMLAHFQRYGHKIIALVGGATAMIGDPSGKSQERNLLTREEVVGNTICIKEQLSRFLDFSGDNPAILVDNYDWISLISFIDWLRDVGKHFSVKYMLNKESVKNRIDSQSGISFTEFSYMTMQAHDFLHLFKHYGCTLQGGGNDQWGNITAGIDLVRREKQKRVAGITFPLLTTSTGEKFGKSAGNAIWFDEKKTTPYTFYQYLLQTADEDVGKFLKLMTFLPLEEIDDLCAAHKSNPEKREAQKKLAEELTKTVFGRIGLESALNATAALFGGTLENLSQQELLDVFRDSPSVSLNMRLLKDGVSIVDVLTKTGVMSTKGQARRMIAQGGVYLNNIRVTDADLKVIEEYLLKGNTLILRTGKKKFYLVRVQ